MAINTYSMPDVDLTVFIGNGNITADEVMDTLYSFYHGRQTSFILWILKTVDVSEVTESSIRTKAQKLVRIKNERRNGKSAIVMDTDEKDLPIMHAKTYLDFFRHAVPVETFFSIDEALKWLGIEEKHWTKVSQLCES